MSSGRSPARLVSFSRVPPRCGPDRGRAWHLWSSSARCSGSRPPSRSLRRRSRRLRGDTRRNASSAGYRAAPCGPCGVRASRSGNPTASRRAHSSPCDVSHRASDEPRRRKSLSSALAPSSLASPSIRRVFVRSFCACRRPVSELNPRQMCRDAIRRYMTLIDPNCFANNFVRTVISFRRA